MNIHAPLESARQSRVWCASLVGAMFAGLLGAMAHSQSPKPPKDRFRGQGLSYFLYPDRSLAAQGLLGPKTRRFTMNRKRRGRFMSMLRAAAPLGVLLVFSTSAHAAVSISAGAGAGLVTPQATGIYSVVVVNKDGTKYTTLGLFNKGKLLEAHTTRPSGWLTKKSGNSAKVLSTATFQQLIGIAGLNKDVETMPAAKRTQFYQAAGLSLSGGGSPLQPEVPPGPTNQCPLGYELIKKPGVGFTCRLLTYWLDGVSERFASLWNSLAVIPPAEAAQLKQVFIHVGRFSLAEAAYMKDDVGREVYQFSLLGLIIEFFFTPDGSPEPSPPTG